MKSYTDRTLLYVHDGRQYIDTDGTIYGSKNDVLFLLKERYKYLAPKIKFAQRTVPLLNHNRDNLVNLAEYGIDIVAIPEIMSLHGILQNRKRASQILKEAIFDADIIILRNSTNAFLAQNIVEKLRKPYILEVVSCNWDALWNYSLKGKIYAPYAFLRMKRNVAKAKYAMYVTQTFLQHRYPNHNINCGISDVIINQAPQSVMIQKHHSYSKLTGKIILTTCAAVDVKYKGQEYVIRAIAQLGNKYDIEYHLAGGGDQSYLKKIACKYGLEDKVIFHGFVSSSKIQSLLDQTTIYCQPSKQEGLPRAVVEAMSRGCVCIGTKTGGIPELLDNSVLVRKNDEVSIATCIDHLLSHSSIMIAQSQANYNNANHYSQAHLDALRKSFYDQFISDN